MQIEYISAIDSTNSELMRRATDGDFRSVCLVAHKQTEGRGRLGRTWLSNERSLTFSLGIPLTPQDWSGLSLAVGLSIAESLHARIQIKWPNDLWVDGKKLAGILIETAAMKHHVGNPASRYVVIGIGINIEAPADHALQAIRTPPCGLHDLLATTTAQQALILILEPLLGVLHHFEHYGWKPYAKRFAARDALQGKRIALSSGLTGQYLGISDHGALLLQTDSGVQTIISNEVSVCL